MYFMRQQAFKMLILNSESLDLTLLEQVTKILSASNFLKMAIILMRVNLLVIFSAQVKAILLNKRSLSITLILDYQKTKVLN
jgi:hypothetical protein